MSLSEKLGSGLWLIGIPIVTVISWEVLSQHVQVRSQSVLKKEGRRKPYHSISLDVIDGRGSDRLAGAGSRRAHGASPRRPRLDLTFPTADAPLPRLGVSCAVQCGSRLPC